MGSGYEERYQERWGEELLKTVKKEFCCIAEIMLHVVTQSQAVYAGTAEFDTFLIIYIPRWFKAVVEKISTKLLGILGICKQTANSL